MAVSFGGFSIRDYASKMRSVDVTKCWPFKEIKAETMDDFLPPIPCRRFGWWLDEVERLKKDEETVGIEEPEANLGDLGFEEVERGIDDDSMVKICPICGNFSAVTINAVNAHIDSCLAQASREERRQMRMAAKVKSRTPKKRSIVELFAVAPQIETVDDDDDGDRDEGEDDEVGLRESEKPKRRKNRGDGLEMGRKKVKKKKKKKKSTKNKGIGIFGLSNEFNSKQWKIHYWPSTLGRHLHKGREQAWGLEFTTYAFTMGDDTN